MRARTLLFLGLAGISFGQIGPADFYTDLAGTTAGTTLTTTILNNGTIGNANHGGWTITGTGLTAATHVSNCTPGGTIQIDGTIYPTNHTTLAMAVDNSGTLRYITATTPSTGYTQAVQLVCFTPQTGASPTGIFDILSINGDTGSQVLAQLSTTNCAGSLGFDLETVSPTAASSCISATSGTSYWLLLFADYVAGSAKLAIYDTSYNQIGSTLTLTAGTGQNVGSIRYGQVQTGTSTGSNTFEYMFNRWTADQVFPFGPVTTTEVPVYWIAKSLIQGSGSASSTATTKAVEVHTGDTIVVAMSSENASMTVSSVADSGASNTFSVAAGCKVSLATQGAMEVWRATNAVAGTYTFTANHTASTFRNLGVMVMAASTFDLCGVGTTAAGNADCVTAAFTPTTSNGSVVSFAYITAGAALTQGTNYSLLNTSATTSFGSQIRVNAPKSSQTATMVQANTATKWCVAMALKGPGGASVFQRLLTGIGL